MTPTSSDNSLRRLRPTDSRDAYHRFRWEQLRRPWGQAPDPTDTDEERNGDHVVIEDSAGQIIACGRLVLLGGGRAQIRSMAVAEQQRGLGLGRQVLDALEHLARGRGIETLRAQVRDTAQGFYLCAGYRDTGPGETLFGQIAHRWMEKAMDCSDFSAYGLTRRAATDDDGAAVARLVFDVLAGYGMAPEHDGIDRDLQALAQFYAGGFFDLLEDHQGRLRGTVAVLPLGQARGELRRMYLDPACKSRGLGRACLGHALAWSRRHGWRELELETATALHEARQLYIWAGFKPIDDEANEARRCDLRMRLRDF